MAIGRTLPWAPTTNSPAGSDLIPPNPGDSISDNNQAWLEMIGAKRVQSADVTIAIPRIDWVTGTVFDQYDSNDSNLYLKDYYVLTSVLNVYKCISNANGAASTVEPTGTSTTIFSTADGYRWKYMYSVSSLQSQKFLTPQFIPVALAVSGDGTGQSNVQDTAVAGQIVSYKIVSGGTGFVSAPALTVVGDGTGATATASVSGGTITGITVTGLGVDYNYATVTVGGPGTGAVIQANIAPAGGHGKNAIIELGGYYVAIAVRLEYSEGGDITTENDYRRISIVRNPKAFGTNTVFTGATARQTHRLTVAATTGFLADEQIIGNVSGTKANIVEIDSVNKYIYVTNVTGVFTLESISGSTSLASTTVSAVQNPEMALFSGDITYTETRKPQPRDAAQVERIITIIEW